MSYLKNTSKKAVLLSKYAAMVLSAIVLFGTANAKEDPNYPKNEVMKTEAYFGESKQALNEFVSENLVYPEELRTEGLEALVEVEFVVNRFGTVTNVEVSKSEVTGGAKEGAEHSKAIHLFESAAKDAVLSIDKWTPSTIKGQTVDQRFRLPIRFEIQG